MMHVDQATSEIIARAIASRARRGAFGVLVREMPEYDRDRLLQSLGESRKDVALRVAMPGFPIADAKALKETARRAGFDETSFATNVEHAERWRNDPSIGDTIVVIAPRELPKLNSLNRFETLSGQELYKQVCEEAQETICMNDAQRQLWRAFRTKPIMKIIALEGLLAYFAELRACRASEVPTRSRESLHLLGFLPDPELFTQPTASKIAQRLFENQRVVSQIEVLSRTDRQRISKVLAARAGLRDSGTLQDIYQRVMAFYREQEPARLKELTLREVNRLLRAKKDRTQDDQQESEGGNGEADSGGERTETQPAVRAVDLLLAEDLETLGQLAEAVRRTIEAEGDDEESEARDPETGATLDLQHTHPFMKVIERYVGPDRWGGLVDTPASTLDEAIALLDKAEFRPFDPNGEDWALRRVLAQTVEELELDAELVRAYDTFNEVRHRLARDAKELLLYPLIQINASPEYFADAELYLTAYKQLIEGLKQSYEAIAQIAPEGVEVLCSQVLSLDTIVFRTSAGLKAILSPLHPLHLWKFIELSRQLRLQAGTLTKAEKNLLRSRVDDLPNFVTTLYLSNYITGCGPRLLPEAGTRSALPFFEELAHRFSGRDGIPELMRLLEKFGVLYPHSRMGLRLVFVDPPDVNFLLRELVKMADRATNEIDAVHVRLFFTGKHDAAVAALGGGAEDEEGPERFRGAGSTNQFTLEVHDNATTQAALAVELEAHPAHVAVYFDASTAKTHRFPRMPSLSVHPLCLPMQFSYDRITRAVRVVPASDGGIFADHNDLRNRLSHQLTGSFFGVTAELRAEQRDLANLAKGCAWLVILDRAQEGALSFGVPRVSLQRCGKRDLAVYAVGLEKFVGEFDRQLRRCNYSPSRNAVERLIGELGMLLSDGLLALVAQGSAGNSLDERRTQGLVGTLVTSAWYRSKYPRSLLVSIDSRDARRWLELVDDASRADLFGITDEADGSVTLDLIEVKTYQQPEQAYRVSSGQISGEAIDQLLNTVRIVDDIFNLNPEQQRVVSPQRREVLRQQLFRECFFEGRSDAEKLYWSNRLNELFALDVKIHVRLSLVVVGLTQVHESTERTFRADARQVRLVELTEEDVRRQVTDASFPPEGGRSSPPPGGISPERAPIPSQGGPSAESAVTAEGPIAPERDAVTVQPTVGESVVQALASSSNHAPAAVDAEEASLIQKQAAELRRILRDHGIPVQELDAAKAQIGPSVVRFRVRLKPGAKVATLRSRAEDIGRELACRTTPFIDNIAGENYVGVDLERSRRQVIPLFPAIDALPHPSSLSLPVATGVTPDGSHVDLDLVQLPHLLIAGSTMSGKTVFLHAVLLSLIAMLPPDKLQLLIIDPKATDFVFYNGLPCLRGGRVFTEAEDAIEQLRSLTGEELRERTRALQQARCPNLGEYNATHPLRPITPIVVVIDEYADLIAVLGKRERADFEREINRLAQRARSVGIHLVLATQRPTADIVTGLLKANMPCRISFRLPQRVDSQTILDQSGAENLFGRGDMLLLQNDRLTRLQGYYVAPAEMADFLGRRFPGSGHPPADDDFEPEPLDLAIDDSDPANHESLVGVATGLVAVANDNDLLAGGVLRVEVEFRRGAGECEVIGSSGTVLHDSATAAWRYVQTHAKDYGVTGKRIEGKSAIVHMVDIAQRREGPSGGLPFVVAMLSALTERPVRAGLALTGEVSVKGMVTAVGGVPQKVVAAYKHGRKLVLLPKSNEPDLDEVPPDVRSKLDIRLVEHVREAIHIALEGNDG